MGRRDYQMEAAVAAVEGRVTEPIVRALIVGAPGSKLSRITARRRKKPQREREEAARDSQAERS
jgi:hypothetical protein